MQKNINFPCKTDTQKKAKNVAYTIMSKNLHMKKYKFYMRRRRQKKTSIKKTSFILLKMFIAKINKNRSKFFIHTYHKLLLFNKYKLCLLTKSIYFNQIYLKKKEIY